MNLAPRAVIALTSMLVGFLGTACKDDSEPVWVQFNQQGDSVVVGVGAAEIGEPVSTLLYSSSGLVEIGSAEVDPGQGPIGTEHHVMVEVYLAWENKVGRATVRTASEGRGEDEYDLEADSADEGYYSMVLISVGDRGEQRSDTLTFRIWRDQSDEEGNAEDTGG